MHLIVLFAKQANASDIGHTVGTGAFTSASAATRTLILSIYIAALRRAPSSDCSFMNRHCLSSQGQNSLSTYCLLKVSNCERADNALTRPSQSRHRVYSKRADNGYFIRGHAQP